MTELDSNKTLSGTYKYINSSDMYIILLLEDVCFWTHYHRVILIKPATLDDEQTDEKPSGKNFNMTGMQCFTKLNIA